MAFMGKTQALLVLAGAMVLALGFGCSGGADEASKTDPGMPAATGGDGDGEVAMVTASQVSDLLNARCATCHSGAEAKEELHLDSIGGFLKGGEHGVVVVPGNAAESKVLKHMRGDEGVKRMPPPPNDPLTAEQIKMVEDWINAGAKAE